METIDKISAELEEFKVNAAADLENFRLKFLSKKSELQTLLSEIKNVPAEQRKAFGQQVNLLKQKAQSFFDEQKQRMEDSTPSEGNLTDITRPGATQELGSRHPISIMMDEVCNIFEKIGFTTVSGPDIEDDWHIFTALNFPEEHPARDMQDTFFIDQKPDIALRTHSISSLRFTAAPVLLEASSSSPARRSAMVFSPRFRAKSTIQRRARV